MGAFTSFIRRGLLKSQMLSMAMRILHRQLIQKDVNFEDFHAAILDIWSWVSAAFLGIKVPPPKEEEIRECFKEWSSKNAVEKNTLLMKFLMRQLDSGMRTKKMLSVFMRILHRQLIQKNINNFEDFRTAILDIFSRESAAFPGLKVPPPEEVEECFKEWSSKNEKEKNTLLMKFLMKQLDLRELDELDDFSLVMGLVTAVMAVKRAGENLPQLKSIKDIPDVVFLPSAIVIALISVKISRKMFLEQLAS